MDQQELIKILKKEIAFRRETIDRIKHLKMNTNVRSEEFQYTIDMAVEAGKIDQTKQIMELIESFQ